MTTPIYVVGDAARVRVPDETVAVAIDTLGRIFAPLCGVDPTVLGRDHVDPDRYRRNVEALDLEMPIAGAKLLEIGCGFGVGLAVMAKEFGVDAWGVEPASEGFDSSLSCARSLFDANGPDPARVVDAVGEKLPFPVFADWPGRPMVISSFHAMPSISAGLRARFDNPLATLYSDQ